MLQDYRLNCRPAAQEYLLSIFCKEGRGEKLEIGFSQFDLIADTILENGLGWIKRHRLVFAHPVVVHH